MKNIVLMAAGSILLLLALICPLPAMLAVPGMTWRIIIGLLGCIVIAFCIRRQFIKDKR